jgi:hypothetical protein
VKSLQIIYLILVLGLSFNSVSNGQQLPYRGDSYSFGDDGFEYQNFWTYYDRFGTQYLLIENGKQIQEDPDAERSNLKLTLSMIFDETKVTDEQQKRILKSIEEFSIIFSPHEKYQYPTQPIKTELIPHAIIYPIKSILPHKILSRMGYPDLAEENYGDQMVNCWGTALYFHGKNSELKNQESFYFYFSTRYPYYRKVETPEPGDLINIYNSDDQIIDPKKTQHGSIYINEDMALTKNGYDDSWPLEISPMSEMFKLFKVGIDPKIKVEYLRPLDFSEDQFKDLEELISWSKNYRPVFSGNGRPVLESFQAIDKYGEFINSLIKGNDPLKKEKLAVIGKYISMTYSNFGIKKYNEQFKNFLRQMSEILK